MTWRLLLSLPREMYAELACFIGAGDIGDRLRIMARSVRIKHIHNDNTYLNGLMHSFNDLPAKIDNDGDQYWYCNGKLHRDNKPAVICAGGNQYWYQHDKLHRNNDLPAVICANGDQYWYQHDKRHRDNDLPAIICANGYQAWYQHYKLHRDNGPAVIKANGDQYWYRNGIQYFP
jgi:hypothetical protein